MITIVPQFGHMPFQVAVRRIRLFAGEVLLQLQKMGAPLRAAAMPEAAAV